MAQSFAFAIAGKVLDKVASVGLEGICLAWGVKTELKQLKETLLDIKAVLLDAEEKQDRDQKLSRWLEKLKDAFYHIEDLVDEFEIEALRRQVLKLRSTRKKVQYFFSSSNPIAFRFKMGQKLKKAKEMLDRIAADKEKFNLDKNDESKHLMQMDRETYSFVKTSEVIGREGEKEEIIDFLMKPTEEEHIPILPIVGIGGLGKTTLAQLVYNAEEVATHFQLRMWVCVSDNFNIRQLMINTIKSTTGDEKCNQMNKEQLQKALQDCLKDKKFLLILDDVWNEDKKKWVEFKDLLSDGAKGSKIIITTRSDQVASVTGTIPKYDLGILSDKDALSLFLKFAFREGEEKRHPNLVKIGEEIVRKCKGVALAVKTLGSHLCSTTAEEDWRSVRDNEIWRLPQKENDIMPALKLSYDQLPWYLKQCFAYCSIFPKDRYFLDLALIAFWMAHGLLQSSDKNEEPEDIGKRYVNELCLRSFFQEVEDGPFAVYFKIHDLLHDLALSVAQNEVKSVDQNPTSTVRHLWCDDLFDYEILNKLDNVRTIRFSSLEEKQSSDSLVETCISNVKHLRALHCENSSFEELPNSIGNLKHLRYLELSGNMNIKKFPNSICRLQSLQTLFLSSCLGIEELPCDIRLMISLRTLVVTTKQSVLQKNGIGCLSSLRFLEIFYCQNLKYLFEDIQCLTSLRTLVIWGCENLMSLPQSLKWLTALECLVIVNCQKLDLSLEMEAENGAGVKEDGSLRKLWISGLPKLEALPQWILLQSAKSLHRLVLENLENLSTLPTWFKHLTSLRVLWISNCPKLSSLPEGFQHLTSLQELIILNCPTLSRRCEAETGEDWHNIAHIPDIYIG